MYALINCYKKLIDLSWIIFVIKKCKGHIGVVLIYCNDNSNKAKLILNHSPLLVLLGDVIEGYVLKMVKLNVLGKS